MASSKFILRTEEALLTALLATELKAETDTEPITAAKTRNLNMEPGSVSYRRDETTGSTCGGAA